MERKKEERWFVHRERKKNNGNGTVMAQHGDIVPIFHQLSSYYSFASNGCDDHERSFFLSLLRPSLGNNNNKKKMRVERARRRRRRRIEGEKTWRVKNSIIGDEVGFFDDSPPSLFILRFLPGVVG